MENLSELLLPLTVWHWLVLGMIIIGLELMIGTFDLLWIGTAALITGAYSAFVPAPFDSVVAQLTFFAVSSVALIILGRTVFSGMRRLGSDRPSLNRRMESLVGRQGRVTQTFSAGTGRVKLGDTEWLARAIDGNDPALGDTIIVESAESNAVLVRLVA